jgi:fatty acid desaturase
MTMTKKKEERAKVGAYNFLIVGLTFFFFLVFSSHLPNFLVLLLFDFVLSQKKSTQ